MKLFASGSVSFLPFWNPAHLVHPVSVFRDYESTPFKLVAFLEVTENPAVLI